MVCLEERRIIISKFPFRPPKISIQCGSTFRWEKTSKPSDHTKLEHGAEGDQKCLELEKNLSLTSFHQLPCFPFR